MLNHQSTDSYSCQGCDVMKSAFECALCSFLCDSETVFRSHLNAEHKSNFLPCIYCETLYNASHFLLRHLKATHSLEAKVYRCGTLECTFKTIIVKRFLSHLNLCTVGKGIKCYHCKSTFSSPNLLILHMQGQLKVLLNKAYPVDKIIRIVPSPTPQSVSVLQTHSNIQEVRSSIAGIPGKTGKANDILPVYTFADHCTPPVSAPVASSSSKRFSYILPKSVVVRPTLKTTHTYSAIISPQVAGQEVPVTRKLSSDEGSSHVLQDAVVMHVPPNIRNSTTFISHGNLPRNSVLDVSSSGKLNVLICQIPQAEISTAKPLQVPEVINKTDILSNNESPSAALLENELPKKDALGVTKKETRLVTLLSAKVDPMKNVSVKNIIPSNKTHNADFLKPPGMISENDLSVSTKIKSLTIPSWYKSAYNKNVCCVTYPTPKLMFIPVPPSSSVYTVLQPKFSRINTCTDASLLVNDPTTEKILPSANKSSVEVIQSPNIKQGDPQSNISFALSSRPRELKIVPQNYCNNGLNTLLQLSSRAFPSSEDVLNSPVELETTVDQNSLKKGSASLAADENCIAKSRLNSTVSAVFCTSGTLTSESCNETSQQYDVSSVESHCKGTDHTFESVVVPPCTFPLTPITGMKTTVPESVEKFLPESKITDHSELPSLEKSVDNENILPLRSSGLVNKLCTDSYSEKNCDKSYHKDDVIIASNNHLHSQHVVRSSVSSAKQNSETVASEICMSSYGSHTPVVSPVSAIIKKESVSPFACANRVSISTSPTSVTCIKQEVISSCERQFETAVPNHTFKSAVASDKIIFDQFNDYYDDIAAVVSSHCLLSQVNSNAAVSSSDSLISAAQHHVEISQNGISLCTSGPAVLSMSTGVKEEQPSSLFSCSDKLHVFTTSTFVTSTKQESISSCNLQCNTPPLSPIIEKTVAPSDVIFTDSIIIKSEISSYDNDLETMSSTISEACAAPGGKSSDVMKPVDFMEKSYSSHNRVLASSSCLYDVSNIYKEKNAASVDHNANDSDFISISTVPVSNQCIKSVTASSAGPFQILSDANYSFAVCKGTNSFNSVSSSHLFHLAGSTVSLNRGAVCDVTFTTLSVKPEVFSNSSHSITRFPSVMDTSCDEENSICGLPLCATVETTGRSKACDISSAQHSAKIFSTFVPVKLIVATSSVGCTTSKSSNGVQCGGCFSTVMSSCLNQMTSIASCVSQNSIASSICNSQHTVLRNSTCSSVSSFCEDNSQGQSFAAAATYDCQSSHTHVLKNNIPHPDHLNDVTCSELSAMSLFPETAEKLITRCTRESSVSCRADDACRSDRCATNSSSFPDDRHPFLNSTNMTVRQILDKFRGKNKNNSVNSSKKSSLRTTRQTCKNAKDLRKLHIQSSDLLLSPGCTTLTPRASKTILKSSVLKKVSHFPADTSFKVVKDISLVCCKRKGGQVLEMNTTVENPTHEVQEVDGEKLSLSDNKETHRCMNFSSECSIKNKLLSSCTNEQSISTNALTSDEYCFSHLETVAFAGSRNIEDMCSATDILQVARELLSYNETPVEPVHELTNILQSLKQKKSEKALKDMLQPLKLKDFFKCMAKHCNYTSNICVKFSKHLKNHLALCCTCAYCLVDFPAHDNLICHLMQEHKRSLFQCSLCFYRAYSQTQVCVHFRKLHSYEKGHIISCSPVDAHPVSTFKENYMVYYANITKPYSCCFCDCSFSCVAMLDVVYHILFCHPVCSSYVCVECKKQHSDVIEWLIHCQLHGIHLFHCIHCAFGTETRTDILCHISMYHANENLVVFVRSSRHLMLHLEHILKYCQIANLKNLCDISDALLCLSKDQHETEVQVVSENTISIDGILKCLYCLCSTEYASEMQNHLYSKHSQNDMLQYFFCQSQFQTVSEANSIFENLLNSYSSNKQNTTTIDMILPDRNSLTVNEQTVPLQIIFVKSADGVLNLQLPLALCKQNIFRGKYVRIFKSLFSQIQSKIHRKRFKCVYCNKMERHLCKLRQHWRCCHVQTGKKFKYELINRRKYEITESSHKTCPIACHNTGSAQGHSSHSTLYVQSCSACNFCVCGNKTSKTAINNWDQLHDSQCDSTLQIVDSFSLRGRPDSHGYWSCHALSSTSHNFVQTIEVPSEKQHCFHKCKCSVCSCTIYQMFKECCAEMTRNQINTSDVKNKMKQLRNQCTGMVKSYRLVASCYCLMKCLKKTKSFKKRKVSETDKLPTHVNNVKLKVFLRKLPYSVKLPVLYLKEIINLDPVVVLSDIKYQYKVK